MLFLLKPKRQDAEVAKFTTDPDSVAVEVHQYSDDSISTETAGEMVNAVRPR